MIKKIKKNNRQSEKEQRSVLKQILREYKKSNKKEIIIVCIGTPKIFGDLLGPLIGTKLKEENNINIKVYGTLEDPIHALNLQMKLKNIQADHPDTFIVGIDAGISDNFNVGQIVFKNRGINPGRGVGKRLQKIGDCGIMGITYRTLENEDYNYEFLDMFNKVPLYIPYNLSNKIVDIIIKLNYFYNKQNEIS